MQPIATVRLSIPVTYTVPVAARAHAPRVLFVSGDADLRAVATRVLVREGYDVHAVAHSGHALLLCRTTQFEAVVAELRGPDISGPTLAEQLRRHCPALAAVYLANPGTHEQIDDVLVHPFTRDDLIERLRLAIGAVTV